MPVEKWSDTIAVAHLGDDPQFSEDMLAIEQAAGSRPLDVVLDFDAIHFINSSNISQLLRVRKQSITTGGRLVLCGINTQTWGTFLVTGLDKIFTFSDNVTTALATLQIESRK
ncbi:MAG: STAS domain-containing protein [Phycisphaerales bacterium]|jgi:anti-anti-sigma factor|nr:STAS domain-containing protein [Phycisphaerales bacterium]